MTSVPSVLFVGNDASSTQIAASLLRRLVGDRVDIHTAGAQPPDPGGRGDQMLVMMGLDPAREEPLSVRGLTRSDRVIILGTGLDVARVPGRRYEEWDLDGAGLEERVEALAAELIDGPAATSRAARPPESRFRLVAQRIRRRAASGAARRRDEVTRRLVSARQRLRSSLRRGGRAD
jgi:hypothetical protein